MTTPYRSIDVRKQRKLSLHRTYRLCLNGVRHRLLRSVLTLAVVALAVAFFMYLQTETALLRSVARRAQMELQASRYATQTLNRMTQTLRIPDQASKLARIHRTDASNGLTEISAVTGWEVVRLRRLAESADTEQTYLTFFKDLPVGQRVILIGRRSGREAFRALQSGEILTEFITRLAPMHNVRIPGGIEAFQRFLNEFQGYQEELRTYSQTWNRVVERLNQELINLLGPETYLTEKLSVASEEWLNSFRGMVTSYGFRLDAQEMRRIRQQVVQQQRRDEIARRLSRQDLMEKWKRVFVERDASSLEEKMARLDDNKVYELFDGDYTREELKETRTFYTRNRELEKTLNRLTGRVDVTEEGAGGLAGRQAFLLLISLMVCMVGITNAMLMSITERFREIATMKCLGATDRYILIQFMLEASIQGAAGGIIGMAGGLVIAILMTLTSYGGDTFVVFPIGSILLAALFSFLSGVILSILASIYPSWAASRMAPMEAMRVE